MLRQVDLYLVPGDPECDEARRFLEQQEVSLNVRDLTKEPLTAEEIAGIVKHFDLKHFLNVLSKRYTEGGLAESLPARKEIIELIEKDVDLLRKPIIVAGRLMVVGYARDKILQMVQAKGNGSNPSARSLSPAKFRQKTQEARV